MTFLVNGIKEENKISTPIELLIETDSDLLVRKILEKNMILVLSLKEFTQPVKKFGDVRIKILRGMEEITIRSKQTDVTETCKLLFRLGFDVREINSTSKPLSLLEMHNLLDATRQEIQSEQEFKEGEVQEKKAKEKKIYADPKLADAKKVVARTFEKMTEVIARMEGEISMQELKEINLRENDLRKLRMGNNYEKIKESCERLLKILEGLEKRYFDGKESAAKKVITESVLTDIDIQRELMKQSYTTQLKLLGANVGIKNEDYAVFGNAAFFWKFFQKDFISFLMRPIWLLNNLYSMLEICILFILMLGGAFLVYNKVVPQMENLSGLYVQMIKFGCLGILVFAGKFWRKQNILNLLLIYALTILAYRLLTKIIIINFAL